MKKENSSSPEIDLLVQSSQAGDADAFGELYEKFLSSIYKYIYFKVPAEEAEDLTETVFLKAWENIRKYRSGQASFSSWLFRIAHNTVVDYYRTNKETLELEEHIEDKKSATDPKKKAENTFLAEDLKQALKEIAPKQKEVLILKYINGHSNEEIAQIINKSEGAVRILQMRGLQNLKKYMEKP